MVGGVNCKEVGFAECEFLVRDENTDELVDLVRQHAERSHEASISREDVESLMTEV